MTKLYNIYKYYTALKDVQPFWCKGVEKKPSFLTQGLEERV